MMHRSGEISLRQVTAPSPSRRRRTAAAGDLRPAPSEAAFWRQPLGRFVAGDGFVLWCASERLHGFSLWGIPSRASVVRLLVLERAAIEARGASRVTLLADVRRLQGIDPGAFDAFVAYAGHGVSDHHCPVRRAAVVRPRSTFVAAALAGLPAVVRTKTAISLFDDLDAALAWTGSESSIAARLEGILAETTALSPLRMRVRSAIRAQLRKAQPLRIAEHAGVSLSVLQQWLREEGTSLAREVTAVRLAEAKRRLLLSNEPLGDIAADVGCSSLQHLSVLFRRYEGLSPSAWRRRAEAERHDDGG